jgi:hypothetical protein
VKAAARDDRILAAAAALLLAIALIVIIAVPAVLRSNGPGISATDTSQDGVRLTLQASRSTYVADEPIQIEAILTYEGPDEVHDVAGASSGLLGFDLSQLDGSVTTATGWTLDCHTYSFRRGEDQVTRLEKVGYLNGDDPAASYWNDHYAEHASLPAGRWRITAHAVWAAPGCETGGASLEASIEVVVTPR